MALTPLKIGDLIPGKLDLSVDRGERFITWKSRWQDYALLSKLSTKEPDIQMAVFRSCLDDETLKIMRQLTVAEGDEKDPDKYIEKLEEHANGLLNVTIERRNLNLRIQQEGETFDDFLISLKELLKTCNYCENCADFVIIDRIVIGLRDGDTIEKLLGKDKLTLKDCITLCRAEEAAKKYRAEITGGADCSLNAVSAYKKQKAPYKGKPRPSQNQNTPSPKCRKCVRSHGKDKPCPADSKTCSTCNLKGHFAKSDLCKKKSPASSGTKPKQQLGAIIAAVGLDQAPQVRIMIESPAGDCPHLTSATPDSGADRTACGAYILNLLDIDENNLRPPSCPLSAAGGAAIALLGEFTATLTYGDKSIEEVIQVMKDPRHRFYMSWIVSKALGFLPDDYPNQIAAVNSCDTDSDSGNRDEVSLIEKPPVPPASSVKPTVPAPRRRKLPPLPQHAASPEVIKQELMKKYHRVFDGTVRPMKGEKFTIKLREDAKPFAIKTPRTVPYAYRDPLQKLLKKMVAEGVIAPVTEPTEWCAPSVVTAKKGFDAETNPEKIRLCVDYQELNKFVIRERYQSLTPHQAIADISATGAKFFTKFDATSGYWQCPLDEESQKLTPFLTPYGRYKFLRAPFGISCISEHYNRRMEEALSDIPRLKRVVDDFAVYDDNLTVHRGHVETVLQRCEERGVSLNRDKFEFGVNETVMGGYQIGPDGYAIDPAISEAIRNFPTPSSRTDLRSFFGLANQISDFTDAVATALEPLRPLLKAKNEFLWESPHDKAFKEARVLLSDTPILAYYDPKKPTTLFSDASRLKGLGFGLKQQQDDGSWKIVQAGSRWITDTESRYAMIELEMLGIVWAVKKCRLFLEGLPHFGVVTDHRPLVPIINKYHLGEIENPRLQRLKMQLAGYNLTVTWQPGKDHLLADALSRAPVSEPTHDDELAEHDIDQHVHATIAANHVDDINIDEISRIAAGDETYQSLTRVILNGFPDTKAQLPELVKPFWSVRDKLSLVDNLVLYGCRLLIPHAMRANVLRELHSSHLGIARTKGRARLIVYWPGMENDIEKTVRSCKECVKDLPSQQKEPMMSHDRPERVFEHVAGDLFHHAGRTFLVLTDIKSGWPSTFAMGRRATADDVINNCRKAFADTAAPTRFYADNGPQFKAKKFKKFCKDWGIKLITSSPRYPQSNGDAEAAVKSMKKLVRRCWNPRTGAVDPDKWAKGLLQFRNTPRADGASPAQMVFGHPARDTLPIHKRAFAPEWQKAAQIIEANHAENVLKAAENYDKNAKPLPKLGIRSHVVVQDHATKKWVHHGVIIEVPRPREYLIRLSSGRVWRRNRRFVRKTYPVIAPPQAAAQPAAPPPPVVQAQAHVLPAAAAPHAAPPPPAVPDVANNLAVVPVPGRTRSGRDVRPPIRLIEEIE